MAETNGKTKQLVSVLITLLITISIGEASWGLAQIVNIREKQSEITKQVTINTERLKKLEADGSPGLQTHEKKDDARVESLTKAFDKLGEDFRSAANLNATMRDGFGRMDERLKAIEERLKTMRNVP